MTAVSCAIVITDILTRFGQTTIFGAVNGDGIRRRYVVDGANRAPCAGESWTITGTLRTHPDYGNQVHIDTMTPTRPVGNLIRSVLSGPRFPGIGEATTRRLWEALGDRLGDVLDARDIATLISVLGEHDRGHRQVESIITGWPDIAAEPALMAWADRYGLAPSTFEKLLSCYGADALGMLEADPYRLLAFLDWRQVDNIAIAAGIEQDDTRRLTAACEAALYSLLNQGHTWASDEDLRSRVGLMVGSVQADNAIASAATEGVIVAVDCGWQAAGPNVMEHEVACRLTAMIGAANADSNIDINAQLEAWQISTGINLNEGQQRAVRTALSCRLSLITGGAGTGKTTVLRAIFDAAIDIGLRIEAMALSGRAALRVHEATGIQARTIAGWLAQAEAGYIDLKIPTLVVIDEGSMVDLPSLHRVLRLLKPDCNLLITGDTGQLAPVGFGLTLHVLEKRVEIPRTKLTEVMRQAAETGIPGFAAAVRAGKLFDISACDSDSHSGVSLMACGRNDVTAKAVELRRALPASRIIGSIKGRGGNDGGITGMNRLLHEAWLKSKHLTKTAFARGEPVIWTVNDYDLDLWNGSLGRVIGPADGELGPGLDVMFDEGRRHIPGHCLHHLELAWAITTHKAQGSSFDTVIIPVIPSAIMDRTLLYTAVTRATHKVILVGDRDDLQCVIAGSARSGTRGTALEHAFEALAAA